MANRHIGAGMQFQSRCVDCGIALQPDEIAITKRLINRGLTSYWCTKCLAGRLGVPPDVIRVKIAEYRSMGCVLFCKR